LSSNIYSARLSADEWSRSVVKGSAIVLFVVAALLIVNMPLAIPARIAVGLCWGVIAYAQMRRHALGYRSYRDIQVLAGGELRLQNMQLEWVSGELRSGSVLWRRIGWLCIDTQDGGRFAELIVGRRQSAREWRRLQVIWRHIGAAD